ncbi:hypothetical protein DL770_008812 [Monosporascus sp. CRB-9-2]|nr:hypothetical protein DL770_008812 [Monosporascus sp. CRB-9-2]
MADVSDKKLDIEHTSSNEDRAQNLKSGQADHVSGVAKLDDARSRGLQPPAFIANLSPEERVSFERRLVKKIDLRLMPMVILMYILNYIDRNNIAAAKLAGLPEDLNLHADSSEFQTAMIIWGVISAATAAVTNFGGLLAIRFFLGFVEAAYFPGCLYYLSCWYTRKELGLRTAMLYSGALISGAFSGLISAGITGNMDGARGYGAWQWLFIIEGVITIAIAFAAYWVLPNFPRTTSWLSEDEKAMAVWRLEEDVGQDDWISSSDQTFWQGAKMAFADIKTYVLLVLIFGIVASGSVTNFFPAVVKTLGYNDVQSLLLTTPPYVLCVITTAVNAWHADRSGERYWHVTLPLWVAVAAFIIAATVPSTTFAARYIAMMLMRPPAKRAAALAFINAVSNASSTYPKTLWYTSAYPDIAVYASYMYLDWMAPNYVIAMSVNCCTSFMAIVAATVLRFMLARLNKKLDQGIYVEGAINALPGEAAQHGFSTGLKGAAGPPSSEPLQESAGAVPVPPVSDLQQQKKRQLRPKAGRTKFWQKLITTELSPKTPPQGPIQEGPWDPYGFFRETEEIPHFYSGHPMRPNRLRDRENYARWAIEEALREYLPGRYQVSGNLIEPTSVASEANTTEDANKILQAIRAEGQRDIDAEVIHTIRAAAQSLVAASPNSLGPPIDACVNYLKMKKSGEYGHAKLTTWRSPHFPQVDGQEGRKSGFLDNQVTAIVWILSRFLGELPKLKVPDPEENGDLVKVPESKCDKENRTRLRAPIYAGGILADSMGLGKTLAVIACLELLAKQKLNVIRTKGSRPKYRPMAILAPNAAVAAQWIEEICQHTDPEAISQIITSGNGLQYRKHWSGRVRSLSAMEFDDPWPQDVSYVWKSQPRSSKAVIIMSIDTFSSRTIEACKDQAGQAVYRSKSAWHVRGFSIVVVDEGQKVKNDTTRNWKSVSMVGREFTLLVTATPCINSLTDLMGLARLLWKTPSEYLEKQHPDTWKRMEEKVTNLHHLKDLDSLDSWDNFQLVAGRPGLLAKMLYKDRGSRSHDIQLVREFLKYFESLALLKRSPSSIIYRDWEKTQPVFLEGVFPKVEHFTVDIRPDHDLAAKYQLVHVNLLTDYVKVLSNWPSAKRAEMEKKITSLTSINRQFLIAAASVDIYRLDLLLSKNGFGTMAKHIATMRRSKVNFRRLAQFMLQEDDPEPSTALDYLKLAVRSSPILRYILHDIQNNILDRGPEEKIKKLLITEASPILAYYYELVLQFLGFNCRTFHAELSQEARKDLIASFNDDREDSCQIFIQMYTVGSAGSNLHQNCSRVLVTSQASSLAVQWQAIHRVIRVGQKSDVKVFRLKFTNSYHSFRECRQVEKLLPELGTRAQGPMNDVLVQILNLFQREVDEAWKRPEALKLIAEKNLLSDDYITENLVDPVDNPPQESNDENDRLNTQEEGPSSKRQKLNNARALSKHARNAKTTPENGSAGWLSGNLDQDSDDGEAGFLSLKTRNEYYDEYKKLPKSAKSHFSHEKNMLRRMLSYGSPGCNNVKRIWTAKDLENSAVLERAMELMLRVRLGTGPIQMLPLPQIDFSLVPDEQRVALQRRLEKVIQTDQDVDEIRDQLEGAGKKGLRENLPGDISINTSCADIENALDRNAMYNSLTPAQREKAKKADPDDRADIDIWEIPSFNQEAGTDHEGEADDEAVEGEESSGEDGGETEGTQEPPTGVGDEAGSQVNDNEDIAGSEANQEQELPDQPKVKQEDVEQEPIEPIKVKVENAADDPDIEVKVEYVADDSDVEFVASRPVRR